MTDNKTIKFIVDGNELEVAEGTNLLQACLDHGIYIPSLCYLKGNQDPAASCRLCFVEIQGQDRPVTACTVTVRTGMVVNTNTQQVRRLQRTALKLLLSVHHVACGKCPANKKCELQRIAKFLKTGLKPKPLDQRLKGPEIDHCHPLLDYHPNRCVLCGKCVLVCQSRHGRPLLTLAKRGLNTVISFYGEDEALELPCGQCLACVEICPVAALTLKDSGHGTASRQEKA